MPDDLALELEFAGDAVGLDGVATFAAQRPGSTERVAMPIRLRFTNVGKDPLRMLAVFEPARIFFQFEVTRDDGTVVASTGGGKVALDRMGFLQLDPGASHEVENDLAAFLSAPPGAGRYVVAATYRTQYGDATSFKGTVTSAPVRFDVITED